MRKNPHAVALGRIKSPRKKASSIANGRLGGRPASYRSVNGELQRRDGDRWVTLDAPYDAAAKAFLRRHL